MNRKGIFSFVISLAVIALILGACSPKSVVATQPTKENMVKTPAQVPVTGGQSDKQSNDSVTQSEQPAEINFMMPSNSVPEPFRTLEDTNSSVRASEHRTLGGDNFNDNLYERPFTSGDMIYQPDLDIQTVDFGFDDNFFYFTIRLDGKNPDPFGLNGLYAIEIDRNLNGRGDMIVVSDAPVSTNWSVDHIKVMTDTNGDVGGPDPIIPDTGFSGSGYDTKVELQADSAAFSRIDPQDENAIQIAISRSLLGNPDKFLWGAWADNGVKDLSEFYYNDAFTYNEAGSPMRGDHYPLKDLYNLDNTCKLPFGFSQSAANIPGMCKLGVPTPAPGQPKNDKVVCEPPYYLINGKCQYFG